MAVCLGIAAEYGIVYYEIYRGGMSMSRYQQFVGLCCGNLIADIVSGYLIFDNAPAHRGIKFLNMDQISFRRLPKYSPFLNPGNVVSCWKSEFKSQLSSRLNEFIQIAPNGGTLADQRFNLLSEILESIKHVITPE